MNENETPDPVLEQVQTVADLHEIILYETKGRARNGLGWFVTAVAGAMVTVLLCIALYGWTRTISQRDDEKDTAKISVAVGDCRADALAEAFDQAIVLDSYEENRLGRWYDNCRATDGRTFRP